MQSFSCDRDILKYEPSLFTDLYLASQVLAKGINATLTDTVLTVTDSDFIAAGIKAGSVIYLNSATTALTAALEVLSVDSATQLTISALRNDILADAISPNADGADYQYRIATFAPQANEVLFQLTQYYGLRPGNPDSEYGPTDLLDTDVLRQASTFAVISTIYATRAAGLDGQDAYWDKSYYYSNKFNQARARCRIDIDLGKDGVKDLTRYSSSPKLLRD